MNRHILLRLQQRLWIFFLQTDTKIPFIAFICAISNLIFVIYFLTLMMVFKWRLRLINRERFLRDAGDCVCKSLFVDMDNLIEFVFI